MTATFESFIRNEYGRCVGCDEPKAKGLLVCWDCFKYRTDITPFKYFDGSLAEWMQYLRKKFGGK